MKKSKEITQVKPKRITQARAIIIAAIITTMTTIIGWYFAIQAARAPIKIQIEATRMAEITLTAYATSNIAPSLSAATTIPITIVVNNPNLSDAIIADTASFFVSVPASRQTDETIEKASGSIGLNVNNENRNINNIVVPGNERLTVYTEITDPSAYQYFITGETILTIVIYQNEPFSDKKCLNVLFRRDKINGILLKIEPKPTPGDVIDPCTYPLGPGLAMLEQPTPPPSPIVYVTPERPTLTPSSTAYVTPEKTPISTNLVAPKAMIIPDIDGRINSDEWSSAKRYSLNFTTPSGSAHEAILYLAHDTQYLYIGIDSGYNSGWDTRAHFYIDGNHNHILDGVNGSQPVDFFFGIASPDGWGGYNYYAPIPVAGENTLTPPSGFARASGVLNGIVYYEFRVPLSSMTVNAGDTVSIFLFNGGGAGNSSYGCYLTSCPNGLDPTQWANLLIEK